LTKRSALIAPPFKTVKGAALLKDPVTVIVPTFETVALVAVSSPATDKVPPLTIIAAPEVLVPVMLSVPAFTVVLPE